MEAADFRLFLDEAARLKDEGNALMRSNVIQDAISAYARGIQASEHIATMPLPSTLEEDANGQELAEVIQEARALYSGLLLNSAQASLQLKDFKAAIDSTSKVLSVEPLHSKALFRRGLARNFFGDFEGAESDLTKLLENNPGAHEDEARKVLARIHAARAAAPVTSSSSPQPVKEKIESSDGWGDDLDVDWDQAGGEETVAQPSKDVTKEDDAGWGDVDDFVDWGNEKKEEAESGKSLPENDTDAWETDFGDGWGDEAVVISDPAEVSSNITAAGSSKEPKIPTGPSVERDEGGGWGAELEDWGEAEFDLSVGEGDKIEPVPGSETSNGDPSKVQTAAELDAGGWGEAEFDLSVGEGDKIEPVPGSCETSNGDSSKVQTVTEPAAELGGGWGADLDGDWADMACSNPAEAQDVSFDRRSTVQILEAGSEEFKACTDPAETQGVSFDRRSTIQLLEAGSEEVTSGMEKADTGPSSGLQLSEPTESKDLASEFDHDGGWGAELDLSLGEASVDMPNAFQEVGDAQELSKNLAESQNSSHIASSKEPADLTIEATPSPSPPFQSLPPAPSSPALAEAPSPQPLALPADTTAPPAPPAQAPTIVAKAKSAESASVGPAWWTSVGGLSVVNSRWTAVGAVEPVPSATTRETSRSTTSSSFPPPPKSKAPDFTETGAGGGAWWTAVGASQAYGGRWSMVGAQIEPPPPKAMSKVPAATQVVQPVPVTPLQTAVASESEAKATSSTAIPAGTSIQATACASEATAGKIPQVSTQESTGSADSITELHATKEQVVMLEKKLEKMTSEMEMLRQQQRGSPRSPPRSPKRGSPKSPNQGNMLSESLAAEADTTEVVSLRKERHAALTEVLKLKQEAQRGIAAKEEELIRTRKQRDEALAEVTMLQQEVQRARSPQQHVPSGNPHEIDALRREKDEALSEVLSLREELQRMKAQYEENLRAAQPSVNLEMQSQVKTPEREVVPDFIGTPTCRPQPQAFPARAVSDSEDAARQALLREVQEGNVVREVLQKKSREARRMQQMEVFASKLHEELRRRPDTRSFPPPLPGGAAASSIERSGWHSAAPSSPASLRPPSSASPGTRSAVSQSSVLELELQRKQQEKEKLRQKAKKFQNRFAMRQFYVGDD